jgi:hypothetical protein
MNNLGVFHFVPVEFKSPAFSLAVKNDHLKSWKEVNAAGLGDRRMPHHAASLKIKDKFVQAVTIQPGDHISICRYRVFTRAGKRHMAWAGTRVYAYTGRRAKALINAYHPGTGTRRPYLTIDGNF